MYECFTLVFDTRGEKTRSSQTGYSPFRSHGSLRDSSQPTFPQWKSLFCCQYLFIWNDDKYNTKEHSCPACIPEAQLAINNWNITFPLTLFSIAILSYSEDQSPGATLAKSNFGDKKPRLVQTQSNFGRSLTQQIHRNCETLRPWCTSWLPKKDSGMHQPISHVPSLSWHIGRQSSKFCVGPQFWHRGTDYNTHTHFRYSHEVQGIRL